MRALLALVAACGSSSSDKPVERVADAAHDKVIGVGRGDTYGCVVRESGGVDCWGRFGLGRPAPELRRVPGVSDAVAIDREATMVLRATGEVVVLAQDRLEWIPLAETNGVAVTSGCVIRRDGSAACRDWYEDKLTPLPVGDVVAITKGALTCATRKTGQVVCGDRDKPGSFAPLEALGPIRQLALLSYGGCAILETGALRCFALREDGSITDATPYGEAVTGVDAARFANASALSLTSAGLGLQSPPFVLEAIVGGKVVRWDKDGTRVLANLDDAVALANGCALRANGGVACWGSNEGGALAQPTTIGRMRRKPAKVPGATDVAKLALAATSSWALTRIGKVIAWGTPTDGRAAEMSVPAASQLVATSAGNACVLAGEAVHCWTAETRAFRRIHESGIRSIASDYDKLVALRTDGTVVSTKIDKLDNDYGIVEQLSSPPAGTVALISGAYPCAQQGTGDLFCGKTWARVSVDGKVTGVSTYFQSCGITAERDVRCWDYDYTTQLPTAAKSMNIADATDLGVGPSELCIVHANGAVTCRARFTAKDRVVIPRGAVDVEVGGGTTDHASHRCAIMADRSVTCWGSNFAGELGDGSIRVARDPLPVPL